MTNNRLGWRKPPQDMPEDLDKLMESLPSKNYQRKSLVCGVGVNDSPFQTSKRVNGRSYMHTAYATWSTMVTRCYTTKYKAYQEVKISEEWLTFSNFFNWWKQNYIKGFHLDKDLMSSGDKLYSAENCCYLPTWLNLNIMGKMKNPIGVLGAYSDRVKGKYTLDLPSITGDKPLKYNSLEELKEDWNKNLINKFLSHKDVNILPEKVKQTLKEFFIYL